MRTQIFGLLALEVARCTPARAAAGSRLMHVQNLMASAREPRDTIGTNPDKMRASATIVDEQSGRHNTTKAPSNSQNT
eukprot:1433051-Amphidinium_carterae.1